MCYPDISYLLQPIIEESPSLKFLIFFGVEIWCQEDLQSSHPIPLPGKLIYIYVSKALYLYWNPKWPLFVKWGCKRDFPVSLQSSLGRGLPLHQCHFGVGQLNCVL